MSVGGEDYGGPTTAIYAFSSSTQSWKHAADLPLSLGMPTAVVLSNEQLIVSNGARVFHGKLCGELSKLISKNNYKCAMQIKTVISPYLKHSYIESIIS